MIVSGVAIKTAPSYVSTRRNTIHIYLSKFQGPLVDDYTGRSLLEICEVRVSLADGTAGNFFYTTTARIVRS